jgi:hypothetical protein
MLSWENNHSCPVEEGFQGSTTQQSNMDTPGRVCVCVCVCVCVLGFHQTLGYVLQVCSTQGW